MVFENKIGQALRAGVNNTPEPEKKADTENKAAEEKTINVPEKAFLELVEEVRKLKDGGVKKAVRVKDGERTAKMRVYKNFPVVEMKNFISNEVLTASGKENRLTVELFGIVEDGSIKSLGKEDYLNFLNDTPRIEVSLNNIKERLDRSINLGARRAENPNPLQDKFFVSREVDMEVTIEEVIYNITINEGSLKGKSFDVSEKALNL